MTYDAFISYSHAADGRLAPSLQVGLARLATSRFSRRGLKTFRDETGIGADARMWNSIQSALDQSDWFVLLASPEAASSRWVNREVEYWLTCKSEDRILLVLTDGHIAWNDLTDEFSDDSTAIPRALRTACREEPRYVDVRWARTEDEVDTDHPRFRGVLAQLAAPMRRTTPAALEVRDVRTRRRTRRILARTLAALAVLLVAVSLLMVRTTIRVAQVNERKL